MWPFKRFTLWDGGCITFNIGSDTTLIFSGNRLLGAMTSHLGQIVHLLKKFVLTRKCDLQLLFCLLITTKIWLYYLQIYAILFRKQDSCILFSLKGIFRLRELSVRSNIPNFMLREYKIKLSRSDP